MSSFISELKNKELISAAEKEEDNIMSESKPKVQDHTNQRAIQHQSTEL